MSLNIVFSEEAEITANQIYDFIEEHFGKRSAIEFKAKTQHTLATISKFPYMFKAAAIGDNFRIGLITGQTSVLYQVKEDSIYLHYFWDNRQEPFL